MCVCVWVCVRACPRPSTLRLKMKLYGGHSFTRKHLQRRMLYHRAMSYGLHLLAALCHLAACDTKQGRPSVREKEAALASSKNDCSIASQVFHRSEYTDSHARKLPGLADDAETDLREMIMQDKPYPRRSPKAFLGCPQLPSHRSLRTGTHQRQLPQART